MGLLFSIGFFFAGWSFLRSIPYPESPVPTSALPVPGAGFKRYQVLVPVEVPVADGSFCAAKSDTSGFRMNE